MAGSDYCLRDQYLGDGDDRCFDQESPMITVLAIGFLIVVALVLLVCAMYL